VDETRVPGPTADVSVRLAWGDDAAAIARVQIDAWHERYREALPEEVLDTLRTDDLAEVWAQSINSPRDARQRVLVALERTRVRGFAATAPSTDGDADGVRDGELVELEVAREARRQGHGSRLLHAVVDTMRADRFVRATIWLNSGDAELRGFLESSGWAADGARRELDLHGDGAVRVPQVRLHTDLTRE
jgi:ribosomal protein S18 acetylase RimI-like enzyme